MQNSTGRRERRRERVRVALLDASMALFAERGLHATRVEDITDRADLGKGAFYNYFESKDALIGELLRMGIDRLESDYLQGGSPELDLAGRIDWLVRQHDLFFEERPEYMVLFHQARGLLHVQRSDTPHLRSIFADYLRRVGNRLVGRSPVVPPPPADSAASPEGGAPVPIAGSPDVTAAAPLSGPSDEPSPLGGVSQLAEEEQQVADLAALVVGAVSGYRSYRLATGQTPRIATIAGVLNPGIQGMLSKVSPD